MELALVAAFIIAAGLFVYFRKRKSAPSIRSYPQYVTEPCDGLPLDGTLSIEVEAIGPFAADATLTPFLQRKGDDWSAKGEMETYRWWASFATVKLVPGSIRVEVPFDANWTAVLRSSAASNPKAYREALAKASRVGFTIGNVTGLGHGKNPPGALGRVSIEVRR